MIKKIVALNAIILASIFSATAAHAQSTSTSNIYITNISSGWSANTFSIGTAETVINPAGCPHTDVYSVDGTAPGFKLHVMASITAFQNNQKVQITVSNTECASNGRPEIIGVRVYGN
ncbi:hypothetical protein [Oleiagrimonas soli]|uniref:ABC-type proline/glycine betaine transport system substrate-binding protein n=1 Tax=Oleiagrimonas soli TaxID=1543381 RepID=A0A841KRC2_9GAMM|nr:hypothetical protein [Oleiagrimonas soli]MBB6184504.1 ABC-type proline/glycine betaine transport system substrate-binding protein [Oleiagrimonas soli]